MSAHAHHARKAARHRLASLSKQALSAIHSIANDTSSAPVEQFDALRSIRDLCVDLLPPAEQSLVHPSNPLPVIITGPAQDAALDGIRLVLRSVARRHQFATIKKIITTAECPT
jgi:hypothetical protein